MSKYAAMGLGAILLSVVLFLIVRDAEHAPTTGTTGDEETRPEPPTLVGPPVRPSANDDAGTTDPGTTGETEPEAAPEDDSASAAIRGTVVHAGDATPVRGAHVTAWQLGVEGVAREPAAASTSGRDGRFRLPVPPGHLYVLRASHAVEGRPCEAQLYSIAAPDDVRLSLVPCTASLDLEIVDAEGTPVAGAAVRRAQGPPGRARDGVVATTDGAGHVWLGGLPEGWNSIQIEAEGYLAKGSLVMVAQETRSRILLERGRRVSLRVLEADSREPVVGAEVRLRHSMGYWKQASTSPSGHAEFHVSGAPGLLEVTCRARGHATLQTQLMPGTDSYTLELDSARSIRVGADESAGPLRVQAEVIFMPSQLSGGVQEFTVAPGAPHLLEDLPSNARLLLAAVDTEGRACFRDIPIGKGPSEVTFQDPEQDPGRGAPLTLTIRSSDAQAPRLVVRLTAERLVRSRLFRRHYVLTEEPVTVWRPQGWPFYAERLVNGKAIGQRTPIAPSKQTLRLAPPRVLQILGTVESRSRRPAVGAFVMLYDDQAREIASATAGPEGRFTLQFSGPGSDAELRMRAFHKGAAPSEFQTVSPGDEEVRILLGADRSD